MKTLTLTLLCLFSLLFLARGGETPPAINPPPPTVLLDNFKLVGDLSGGQAAFTLTATARVDESKGGSLEILSGPVALTEFTPQPQQHLRVEPNRFIAVFEHRGTYTLQLKFNAALRRQEGWSSLDFHVAPSALAPIVLRGLPADTKFEFANAARPDRSGDEFRSYLAGDGSVKLSWKEARTEAEGKLFYAAEMLSQITLSPGLMSQVALLDFKVMQGELNRVALRLHGLGEVTRVQGDHVLSWAVEPGSDPADRRLLVQLNQPQKDQFALQVQMQTPLGAFPQSIDALQLRPEGATRFAGYCRIVNEGAVSLEVVQASGLSQISPEQFPETDATRAALHIAGSQRFAYRFSGEDFALRIQADQILPELNVSQVLAYRLAENELAIDAEIELDIREAPLRELLLRVPKAYAIARLSAQGLTDYFLREPEDQPEAELRLVYGQPVSGRQIVQLRLEHNQALGETVWTLPRVEVLKAKSVRGHLAAASDPGFRLTAERTQGLTEIATAFFPRKVAGIQTAFRLSDPAWQASLRVERLPQTVQADVLHLFSIGEGIAYGSSVVNYLISGAPVSVFKVELSDEYFNVEFVGKDIRNWQKAGTNYLVQLQTPVSGPYTLLATYERPFKSQGETLTFTGARPLDAQSEQGHTVVTSAYQFQVRPVDISSTLLALEPGEVPVEYRLFFDAPILAAYRYNTRPFNLKLALSPLAQGDSLSQLVDRASLITRISKEGQVLTDAHYLLKNRGHPNFRLVLPPGTQLWSASVNGASVVPVTDTQANLIPLPQLADPNAILSLDLKLASTSTDPAHVRINAPVVDAPVMLGEWKVEPDTGQRLEYRQGSLTPVGGLVDRSGFAGLARLFTGSEASQARTSAFGILILVGAALALWRWTASSPGVYKFSSRHISGTVVGLFASVLAAIAFFSLMGQAHDQRQDLSSNVVLLAPVQQSGSPLTVDVANLSLKVSPWAASTYWWPVLITLVAWAYGWLAKQSTRKLAARVFGWLILAWTALRTPNGAPAFLLILGAFLLFEALRPALVQLWRLPRQPQTDSPAPQGGAAPAAAALLVWAFVFFSARTGWAAGKTPAAAEESPVAQSVSQTVRIEEKFALATAKIRWQALKNQVLPVLWEPAVLTGLNYSTNFLELRPGLVDGKRTQQLRASKNGLYEIELQYQVPVTRRDTESGFLLPVAYGLVNQLQLTVVNLDVDVLSPQAVSIKRESMSSNTVASVVLSPVNESWIGWKPRSRDVTQEKAVFYAELTQLYVPMAGVIEGAHWVSLRPAQGELKDLVFDVPAGATITDVIDPARIQADGKIAASAAGSVVSLWRFDPDSRKLRVTLSPAQSRPFAVLVRSQIATGPLPLEHTVGLLQVESSAGQIGLLGIATGNEVQLENVIPEALSPINLEDYPGDLVARMQGQIAGLTVRRAFRYSDPRTTASLKASAVQPDVRVENQNTLSLGEDRTVLAVNAAVNITRAGIFRLSFVLPTGFDVDAISGGALSHWTELKSDAGRIITLHLTGKTEGQQQFAISLAGPGVKAASGWSVPKLVFREASKQSGTLLLVPEQGMRLQVGAREGVTQLDPQKSGVRQKGVLAFRVLQTPWSLSLDLEQVDPWVQVTSLQHATVNEAQVKVVANLQYQIENTGLKSLRVFVPTNAESVHFQGDQVADFIAESGAVTNGLQAWDIKLHRRVIGPYLLQLTYQLAVPDQASATFIRGVQASDVNLQRGFVTVQSSGRLQLTSDAVPEALQPTEWQSIPRALQRDLPTAAANFAYRLVEPSFQLALKLQRHEAAKLLPARVNHINFNSVISDDGVMLTQVELELQPGDLRLLNLTLPKDARFWFAFVNQNGVWPWREQDRLLIPLEQSSRGDKPLPVEVFYSCRIGTASQRELDLELGAPKFDLPLENITWRVSLSEKWQLKHWAGSLQLQGEEIAPQSAAVDLQIYLQTEASRQRERTQKAEELMVTANSALEHGEPQQARRAFQAAYSLSTHDAAFNEDARVQLHNIKLQQALVGLNVRQAAAGGESGGLAGKLRDWRGRKEAAYTQQDAKDMIDRNTADDNTAFMRLAERIIQQQDAAVATPTAIRANIPEQGRVLTFKRAVSVDPRAELKISLQAAAVRAAGWTLRGSVLVGTLVFLATFAWAASARWQPNGTRAGSGA
jgi:hypothetical protein